MKIIPKVWGWEVVFVSNELYSCKLMVIKGGYQCSIHYHKLKTETFVLLTGEVVLEKFPSYQEELYPFSSNKMEQFITHNIPSSMKHRFQGRSKYSVVLEVATQDLPGDSYRETKSGKIDTTK